MRDEMRYDREERKELQADKRKQSETTKQPTLSNKHLVDIKKYITSLNDHSLYGQVFSQVFGLTDLK